MGRDAELTQLHDWLAKALQGERQIVFVTGEPGIGKTALVEAFLSGMRGQGVGVSFSSTQSPIPNPQSPSLWLGRGQCIEHYGTGEPYLPVLEALGRLCREAEGQQLIEVLSQHAPTWLAQMSTLLHAAELEALQRKVAGATRERMLRELVEALAVITAERPLVLWLEDLHWSDVSTLDWLAFLARRREPARLLLLGTYRPVEVIVSHHPLKAVKHELQVHGQCGEVSLRLLRKEDIEAYLARRFAAPSPVDTGEGLGEGLAPATLRKLTHLIHRRTDGNPLFMITVIEYLVARGVLVQSEGQWTVPDEVATTAAGVPASLQQLIERQLERLSAKDQRILEVASVAGVEFSAAAVAAGVATEVEEVEDRCTELVRRELFLRASGTAEWPDGTVTTRYGFLHALYQEVLYDRLTAGRRQRLHQQIGEREEHAYGEQAREVAAELAVHFERGRDYPKAIRYLQQAGENASRRSAYVEAISLLTKGLELLKLLPDTPERAQQELTLQLTLGLPLMATKGYAAPEVEQAYSRARALCQHLGEAPQLFSALMGLSSVYLIGARLQTAREVGAQCLHLAQSMRNSTRLMAAHTMLGQTLFYLGEFALAHDHLAQGMALYDPQKHTPFVSRAVQDHKVSCLSFMARALWMLGYVDQALKSNHEALSFAHELAHPFSLAYALYNAAILHQFCRERSAAQERIATLLAIAREQGFPQYVAQGTIWRGWVLAEQGRREEGVAQIRQGLAAYRVTGSGLGPPHYLALLAEVQGKAGQTEEGLSALVEALEVVNNTDERFYEAELYRLKGQLVLQSTVRRQNKSRISLRQVRTCPKSPTPNPHAEAEACFLKAIEVARRQSAKCWELRATVSLARLWQQGKKKQARQMLTEIYNWFTEGFDTRDLKEARALLEELGGTEKR